MVKPFLLAWDLTEALCYSSEDYNWDGEFSEFAEEFEFFGKFQGDPDEDYYQGLTFTAVIRDLRDGSLWGYSFWEDISKHGEAFVEPNYDGEGDFAIWKPVTSFEIQGYSVNEKENK